jgi:hypothetical protein
MAKNFLDLHNARSAEAKARVKARVQCALAKMPIQELQQARIPKANCQFSIWRGAD